jgi:hypothetical protein
MMTKRMLSMLVCAGLGFGGCGLVPDELSRLDLASPESSDGDVDVAGEEQSLAGSSRAGAREYEVTIENLMTSQDLSPGILAAHSDGGSFWRRGHSASEGLRLIAEEGNAGVAESELHADPGVLGVTRIDAPLRRVGGPATPAGPQGPSIRSFSLSAPARATRLSAALMLICTNDGFTGLSEARLPVRVGQTVTYYAPAYDAGTELNTERTKDIIDACYGLVQDGRNDRPVELSTVQEHPNIEGGADLDPDVFAWCEPAARFRIVRVR